MIQLEMDQVRELGRQALIAERERCAEIAERIGQDHRAQKIGRRIADAIRASSGDN